MLLSYAALNTTLSTFTSGRIATSPATFPLRKVRNSRSTFARCFGRRNNLVLKRHCIDPSDLQRLVLQGGLLSTRSEQNAPCFHIVTEMGSRPITYLLACAWWLGRLADGRWASVLALTDERSSEVNRTIILLGRRSLVSWATPTMTSKVTLNLGNLAVSIPAVSVWRQTSV